MISNVTFISRYDLRVKLLQDTVQEHTKLDDKAAFDLAVHLLDALDKIPEQVR